MNSINSLGGGGPDEGEGPLRGVEERARDVLEKLEEKSRLHRQIEKLLRV